MWNIFDIAVFCAGFAACWFSKDWLIKVVISGEAYARTLEAKARAIRAAL